MSVETDLLASVIEVIAQSLVYGVFVVLIPISTVILMKRGCKTRHGVIMLVMIWMMFALSTAHWAVNVAFLVAKVKALVVVNGSIRATSDLMNAVVTINLGIADAVVLWRAWVVCKEGFRKSLSVVYGFLGLTAVGIIVTIALRIAVNVQAGGESRDNRKSPVVQALNTVQIVSIGISMLTNLVSTGIVGIYVWRYRRFLRENLERNQTTRAQRVLVLLAESGLFYSIYAIFSIICSVFRVSIGTVGDVTNSVLVHIAGVYPTLIITIVSVQGTVTSSTLSAPSIRSADHIARDGTTLIFARPSSPAPSSQLEFDQFSESFASEDISGRTKEMKSPVILAGLHGDVARATKQSSARRIPDYPIDPRWTV